jgi:hypothetical protein
MTSRNATRGMAKARSIPDGRVVGTKAKTIKGRPFLSNEAFTASINLLPETGTALSWIFVTEQGKSRVHRFGY